MRAYRAIDDRLARDNAKASLRDMPHRAQIIEFPGRDRIKEIQPFTQPGTLDGVVVTVGGRDDPPTVHLQDEGKTYVCHANKSLIRRIAPHIYGRPLRVNGMGRWERTQTGEWNLMRFTIHDFVALKDTPLEELANVIRSQGFSQWGELEHPLEELQKLRHGE